jgi:glycerophosphoryl diester phosphodiesterase
MEPASEKKAAASAMDAVLTKVAVTRLVVLVFIGDFLRGADPPTPRLRRDRVGKELGELPRGEGEEVEPVRWDEVFIG